MSGRILIAYFSMKGETLEGRNIVWREKGHAQLAAEYIQETVGGDIFEIETAKPYPDDHMQRVIQAKAEIEGNVRPEIKAVPNEFDQYDTVFLCYPIWWFAIPMPVATFLESLDWTGKRVIPVNTSNSSGECRSVPDIKMLCGDAAVERGLELIGQTVEIHAGEIRDWAKQNI